MGLWRDVDTIDTGVHRGAGRQRHRDAPWTCTHLAENLGASGLWLEDRAIVGLDATLL
jgi:hypothetical protein